MLPTTTAPAPEAGREYFFADLDKIKPSPTQPRQRRRDGADLVASIRAFGVLEAVWLRTCGEGEYELVFGERRVNAARTAGRTTIKAELHDELSNEDVCVLQNIENAQRADVTPLEEADSYRLLSERFGLSSEKIAARVGREEAHVLRRLALSDLVEEGRAALDAGRLTVDAALAIAAVTDPAAQAEAVAEVLRIGGGSDDVPIGRTRAREIVRARFLLKLCDAQFDRADARLVAMAGTCTSCPKRTGAQIALWPSEDRGDDRCTDRSCWRAKVDAHWARLGAEAKARGAEVLEGEAARKYFPNGSWMARAEKPGVPRMIDLDDVCTPISDKILDAAEKRADEIEFADPDRDAKAQRILDEADELAQTKTWRAILGDLASPRALVRDLRDKFHHLMPEAEALALLEKATGIKPPAPSEPPPPIDAKARREATLDARADELAEERAWQEVIAKATAHPADLPFWRFLAALALDAIDFAGDREVLGAIAERRGIDPRANDPAAQLRQLHAHLEELKQAELKAFVVELLAQHIGGGAWAPEGGLARAARFLGVDLAKLRAAAREKVRAEDAKAAQTDRSQAAGHPSGTPEGPAGALAVPCPTCLREAGRACAAKTGKADLAKPHKARVALAAEDRCAGCGCTASIPCETDSGPCGWSAPGLCSECDAAAEAIVEELELGAREPDALVEHLTGLEYEEERIRKQIERLRAAGRVELTAGGKLALQEQLFQTPAPPPAKGKRQKPAEARP